MESSQQAPSKIIADFKKRKTRQLIAIVPFILASIPLLMLEDTGAERWAGIPTSFVATICIVVMVAIFAFWLSNWRCPLCHSYLGRAMSPKFCQKCGAQLQQ